VDPLENPSYWETEDIPQLSVEIGWENVLIAPHTPMSLGPTIAAGQLKTGGVKSFTSNEKVQKLKLGFCNASVTLKE